MEIWVLIVREPFEGGGEMKKKKKTFFFPIPWSKIF